MKLNGKKFGVEIEFIAPRSRDYSSGAPISRIAERLRAVGIPLRAEATYLSGRHQSSGDFINWLLGTDSSLSGNGEGLELATAPLSTAEDVQRLKTALKVLRDMGCVVNDSCGLHVHHEIELRTFDVERALELVVPAQPVLHGILKRDRQGNEYCKDWTQHEARYKGDRRSDRRKFLNFLPFYKREPHVEFRAHHGSLKFAEIMKWVQITQKVIEVSQERSQPRLPEVLENLLSQPRSYNDLKRRLANFGEELTDAELVRHLEVAQKIEIAGTSYYFLASDATSRLARDLKLDRSLTRYLIGKTQVKREFGDV